MLESILPGFRRRGEVSPRLLRKRSRSDLPPRRSRRAERNQSQARDAAGPNPRERPRWVRWSGGALLGLGLGLVLTGLGWAGRWYIHQPLFQIRRVEVNGALQQVDRDLVVKRVRALRGNFFTLDLEGAAAELRTLPWVRTVYLHRLWPDGLEVQVEEQHPVARWGEGALLNGAGEVFNAETALELPRLDGPAGSGVEMMTALHDFARALAPLHQQVRELGLSERRSWTLELDNGLKLELGREEALARLQRFVQAYPGLFATAGDLHGSAVDLRYPNGFALRTDSPVPSGNPATR